VEKNWALSKLLGKTLMTYKSRKIWYIFVSLILFISMSFIRVEAADRIMPLNQVKVGMKGKGRTIFLGNRIEEFDVEIIGILRNFSPKKSMILARLDHKILDRTGVIEGMSGSPVYIDGKLIGAVAYSIGTFLNEAIAGITPISDMIAIPGRDVSLSTFSPRIPVQKELSLEKLFEMNRVFFQNQSVGIGGGQIATPLHIPLVCSGFSPRVFNSAKSIFSKLGFTPIRAGASGQSLDVSFRPGVLLKGGDSVGVQLISGDLDMTAVGTVTYVDGSKVYAFGHPLYNLGAVDYSMTSTNVLGVAPSLAQSFKLAVPDTKIGRFSQDRNAGVYGELGKRARLIPLNISLIGGRGDTSDYKIFIAYNKILTPTLTNLVVSNILTTEELAYGDLTLQLTGDIYFENGKSIHLEDLYSGNFNVAVTGLSNLIASVVFFLTNNEFRDLDIYSIDLKVRATEEIKFSYLERVWLDKYTASPGETIMIKIFFRNFRGETIVQQIPFLTPTLPSGSEFYLAIADAVSMRNIEIAQYRNQNFIPRSLSQLIRLLSNLRKNNRIYFKVFASKPGLFLKGEEMPNLPPSMKSMFLSPRAASSSPVEISKSTLSQYQIPIDYVFQGAVVVPIKIK
jgi:hypothetical protein